MARSFTTAENEAALFLKGESTVEFIKTTFSINQQRDILAVVVKRLKDGNTIPKDEVVDVKPETASIVLQGLLARL